MNNVGYKFQVSSIRLKSNWFDVNGKYSKMKHEAFDIYINLFRFKIDVEEYDNYFQVDISDLRQVTGYSKQVIYESIKTLCTLKVIKVLNVTRWDRFLTPDKKIPNYHTLKIVAIDTPQLERVDIENGVKDSPLSSDDYYVAADLEMYTYYKNNELTIKHYALYCLMRKLSNHVERKAYMAIEKMGKCLGIHPDVVNKMVHEMNRKYVLFSTYNNNGKGGLMFEHVVLRNLAHLESLMRAYKESNDRNIKKWDKKLSRKNNKQKDG